jgi:hypothetical protein
VALHRNPVEAEIVSKDEEYTFSSASANYYGRPFGLLKIDFLS